MTKSKRVKMILENKEPFIAALKDKNRVPASTKLSIKEIRAALRAYGLPRTVTEHSISHCFGGEHSRVPTKAMNVKVHLRKF